MKITAHKKVFWDSGGRELTGKVKQVLNTHVVVASGGCDYIVLKSQLRDKSSK